jgi:hypothetical protein
MTGGWLLLLLCGAGVAEPFCAASPSVQYPFVQQQGLASAISADMRGHLAHTASEIDEKAAAAARSALKAAAPKH